MRYNCFFIDYCQITLPQYQTGKIDAKITQEIASNQRGKWEKIKKMPKNTRFSSLISQNLLMMLREIFLYMIKQGVDNIISKNYGDLYGRTVFKNSLKKY